MKLFKTGVDSSEVRCRSARTVDYKSRIVSEEINYARARTRKTGLKEVVVKGRNRTELSQENAMPFV